MRGVTHGAQLAYRSITVLNSVPPDAQEGNARSSNEVIAGRYVPLAMLAQGGMGVVYRVYDRSADREIALKHHVGPEGAAMSAASQRQFEREYHTLSQLNHPRIIKVFDYGIGERGPYYTMELLEGDTARHQNAMSWHSVCVILRDIASALSLVHSRRYVHRDVTPNNIYILASGRAKLIDFGAMAPMGTCKTLTGTPAIASPEMINGQALDGRSDLFALGATAYRLLSGRHAFPARTFGTLRDHWRTPPPSLTTVREDIPPALSKLVMSMLSLDASARPSTASEVIQRLDAMAELPDDGEPIEARAYLRTPKLVGRDEELLAVRKQVVEAFAGSGHALFIDGPAGVGRSRFIDACVLEAKLLGITVLRADASDATEDYGAARALGTQLIEAFPNLAARAASKRIGVLRQILPSLPGDDAEIEPASRPVLQYALRHWFAAVARRRPITIAIDDFDLIDEPSAALLATLSEICGQCKMMLVTSAEEGRTTTAPLAQRFLGATGSRLRLLPLRPEQGRSLLASMFGDVPNLGLVADRLHRISEGSPRVLVELAQYALDRGLVCYESGGFVLPDRLDEKALPDSPSDALKVQLAHFSDATRRLGRAWSLAADTVFSIDELKMIAAFDDPGGLYQALDELVMARAVRPDHNTPRLVRRAWIETLRASISDDELPKLHDRIAQVMLLRGEKTSMLRAAAHFLEADEPDEALRHIVTAGEQFLAEMLGQQATRTLSTRASTVLLDTLDRGLALSLERKLARAPHVLRAILVRLRGGQPTEARRHLEPLFERLERDSGLADYRELSAIEDPAERLEQALERAQARHDALPEDQRSFAPLEAVQLLARSCMDANSAAPIGLDYELLEACPDLTPLVSLSPALDLAQSIVTATKDILGARHLEALERYRKVLERLDRSDRAGLDGFTHRRARLGILYALGIVEGFLGIDSASSRADELDEEPSHQVNAWLVRRVVCLADGDVEQAERCRQRSEMLRVQSAPEQWYEEASVHVELLACAKADDLMGIRRVLPGLESMARKYQAWEPVLAFAFGEYDRLRGDAEGALAHYDASLKKAVLGRSGVWPHVVGQYVKLLSDLGRHEEAVERGLAWTAQAQQAKIRVALLAAALAEALARLGRYEEACSRADALLREFADHGVGGVLAYTAHEARARVAVAMHESAIFELHDEACRRLCRLGRNPALTAKYERLVADAKASGLTSGLDEASMDFTDTQSGPPAFSYAALLADCRSATDRASQVLSLLLEQCEAGEGFLVLNRSGGADLAAARGRAPDGLLAYAADCMAREKAASESGSGCTTEIDADTSIDAAGFSSTSGYYRPFLLTCGDSHALRLVGMLMLRVPEDNVMPVVPHAALREAAQALVDAEDVVALELY